MHHYTQILFINHKQQSANVAEMKEIRTFRVRKGKQNQNLLPDAFPLGCECDHTVPTLSSELSGFGDVLQALID